MRAMQEPVSAYVVSGLPPAYQTGPNTVHHYIYRCTLINYRCVLFWYEKCSVLWDADDIAVDVKVAAVAVFNVESLISFSETMRGCKAVILDDL